jgi:hypothetical protein
MRMKEMDYPGLKNDINSINYLKSARGSWLRNKLKNELIDADSNVLNTYEISNRNMSSPNEEKLQ